MAMNEVVTREEWNEVLKCLLCVPLSKRNKVWNRAFNFLSAFVQGTIKDELAQQLKSEGLYYSAECGLCQKPIRVGDSYVYNSGTMRYTHYDCHTPNE